MEPRDEREKKIVRELEILSEEDIDMLIEVLRAVRNLKKTLMNVAEGKGEECKKD